MLTTTLERALAGPVTGAVDGVEQGRRAGGAALPGLTVTLKGGAGGKAPASISRPV